MCHGRMIPSFRSARAPYVLLSQPTCQHRSKTWAVERFHDLYVALQVFFEAEDMSGHVGGAVLPGDKATCTVDIAVLDICEELGEYCGARGTCQPDTGACVCKSPPPVHHHVNAMWLLSRSSSLMLGYIQLLGRSICVLNVPECLSAELVGSFHFMANTSELNLN